MTKFKILFLILFSLLNSFYVFGYLDCTPDPCPSGTTDNGTICDGNSCLRTCIAIYCSGAWKSVYNSSGNDWDLSYEDFKELSEGSFTPTNGSECYKFMFDAPPADSPYINVELNGSSPNCESQAIGGFWDLTDKPNPWFANMSLYNYLGNSPNNAKYNYLLRTITAYVVGSSNQQYMDAAGVDSNIYCANNTYSCEIIANGTQNCATGCYNRGTQIKIAQGRFNNTGSNDTNLFNNLFCGNRYVFNNRYGAPTTQFHLRVYSMPANNSISFSNSCQRTNEPPNATLVNVIPGVASAGQDLFCNYTYVDPEGFEEKDSVYEWWRNGSDQDINYRMLFRKNLTPSDIWYCKVTPSDGLLNGSKVQSSNNVTVLVTTKNVNVTTNNLSFWNYSGYYHGMTFISGFDEQLGLALDNCVADSEGYCNLTISFTSDNVGLLNVSDLQIFYSLPPAQVLSLRIENLSVINYSGTYHVYEFFIVNNGSYLLNNISWKLDMGDGTVVSSNFNLSLSVDESVAVYVAYNYATAGNYVALANASSFDNKATLSTASLSDLIVQNISLLYDSYVNKIFEFNIINIGNNVLNNINWSLNTGDSIIYSNSLFNLTSGEDVKVYVNYKYSTLGNFTAIASAYSNNFSSSDNMYVSVTLPDQNKFVVQNGSGSVVAWFGDFGNVVLKGSLTENFINLPVLNDSFRFQNSAGTDLMIIDSFSGNLYLKGGLFENQASLNPLNISDDFIIMNLTNSIVGYVNGSGSMFLSGELYENSNP